jgi:hypothetical protein
MHAPEDVLSYIEAARAELARLLEQFDGIHQADCRVLSALGCSPNDLDISIAELVDGSPRPLCSCGLTALRAAARSRFALGGSS